MEKKQLESAIRRDQLR